MTAPSQKPYLIRALYEWCLDSGFTPYLAVWVNEHTRVPMQFVQDNQIVLSISEAATKDLHIDNDWIHFHARFGGVSQELWIPVGHVISIFAKENGVGMGFEVEPWLGSADDAEAAEQGAATASEPKAEAASADASKPKKKVLKLVK